MKNDKKMEKAKRMFLLYTLGVQIPEHFDITLRLLFKFFETDDLYDKKHGNMDVNNKQGRLIYRISNTKNNKKVMFSYHYLELVNALCCVYEEVTSELMEYWASQILLKKGLNRDENKNVEFLMDSDNSTLMVNDCEDDYYDF